MMPLATTPLAELTSADDYIRCERLSATLRARRCIERQRMAAQRVGPFGMSDYAAMARYVTANACISCRRCEQGRAVALRLDVAIGGCA